jgi:predicted nucleic acid-binding protein
LIVIDASALLEMLLRTDRADRLMDRALEPSERLHSPHLLDIEVANVVRRLVQRKEIAIARAAQVFEDFAQLAIERHAHGLLLPRIWELRDAMTAYDGAYVALAEALDAPLLTCDGKLARSHGHRATMELVEPGAGN